MTMISDRVLQGPHGPVRVRIYSPDHPAGPGLVWLHGGAFFGGDLDMPEADNTARLLARRGIAVVSVDYRLAPISPAVAEWIGASPRAGSLFPVASDETIFVFRWARQAGLATGPWSLGGASAGGNLAAGATIGLLREGEAAPHLLLLAFPTLHAVQDDPGLDLRAALDAHPAADVFGPKAVMSMYENYLGGPLDKADSRAVPGLAAPDDLAGFPPTILVVAEVDELRLSAEAFDRALRDVRVSVELAVEPGTMHGYLNDPAHPASATTVHRFAARLLAPASDSTFDGSSTATVSTGR